MKKILELIPHPFLNGGIEAFIYNVIDNINNKNLKIDIYTPYYEDNRFYYDIITSKGCNLFSENERFFPGLNQFKALKRTVKFLKSNKYDIIHIHSSSSFALAFYSVVAYFFHPEKIIVHSHSTGDKKNIKYYIIRIISLIIFSIFPTDYFACSKSAAEWKFSKRIINNKVKIINNGIDLNKFKNDNNVRTEYRKKLGFSDNDRVIGHVGRFSTEKNHKFIIDLFTALKKENNAYKLLLIGDGILKTEIEEYAKQKGVFDHIIFTGNVDNVRDYMQAMDLFILPSKFEGLPLTGIEAQACGLPVIFSTGVPEEAKVTENVKFISTDNMLEWIKIIKKMIALPKCFNIQKVRTAGYDIIQTTKNLETIYLK